MIDLSHALKDGNYFEYPFPHWIIDNFFADEELSLLNSHFPSSRSMSIDLTERSITLAEAIKNNDQITALAAMFDLGLRSSTLREIGSEDNISRLEKGNGYSFQDGKTYNRHLSLGTEESSKLRGKNYTKSSEFNNIITTLEDQWTSCLPHVLDACKEKFDWEFPKAVVDSFFCRGDLRTTSPSSDYGHTTLGPHVDSERELFACLIYLRHPEDHSHGGDLILYEKKPDSPPKFMSSLRRIPMKYLNAAKTIKYENNKAILFINHPKKSIHSISSRGSSAWDRRLINLTFETNGGCFWDKNQFIDPKLDGQAAYQKYTSINERML